MNVFEAGVIEGMEKVAVTLATASPMAKETFSSLKRMKAIRRHFNKGKAATKSLTGKDRKDIIWRARQRAGWGDVPGVNPQAYR